MTHTTEDLRQERKLVVVLDICSSTTILEDLKRTDNLLKWRNLLIGLKELLVAESGPLAMEIYKFVGDGWILLFPENVSRKELCDFLNRLSACFDARFVKEINPLLTNQPSPIGLSFGIDAGVLIRMEMNEQIEYIGRAINVAARLQGYTKDLVGGPSYKAVFSKNSFNLDAAPVCIKVEKTIAPLRNISPSTYECLIVRTLEKPERMPAEVPQTEPSKAVSSKSFENPTSDLDFVIKDDVSEQSFVRTNMGPDGAIATATIIVSNNSAFPNAIVRWVATVKDVNGAEVPLDMTQSSLTEPGSRSSHFAALNVTPLSLPPFGSVEAHLLFSLDLKPIPNPAIFSIRAIDRTQKSYLISVSIPKVVRASFS